MESSAVTENELASLSHDRARLLARLVELRERQRQEITPCSRSLNDSFVLLPVSWAQQRLWFIDQLEGGGAAYNVRIAMRLRGTLDREALQKALGTLVRRHEVLRTSFVSVDGEPKQQIAADGCIKLRFVDLDGHGEMEREARVALEKSEEGSVRFDLHTSPLIRGRLLRFNEQAHLLLITMHHIVTDGWSLGVFLREFGQLYCAYHEGREDPLPALRIQYADYAHWQRQWLKTDVSRDQLSYWRTHLDGAPSELQLPHDRRRPAVRSYKGQSVSVVINATLTADLNALARRHGLTLFMTLCSSWAILLSRLSGQEDVVIGTPVANRRRPELEGLIGCFVNTLVLRFGVTGDAPLGEFFQQVKNLTLGAYDHQDIPFEQLVDALRPPRSTNVHPVFQVMFVLQNAPRTELNLPGLAVSLEGCVNETSKFDLLISLEERGGEIIGIVNYDTDLFDRETVHRWVACLNVLLERMAKGSELRVGDLSVLTEEERQRVEGLNHASWIYGSEKLLHELFQEQAARTPHAVALIHDRSTATYSELNTKSSQLAHYLRKVGVGPEAVVGICIQRSVEMVIGILGILKAGGAYMPLDPNYPADRLEYMLEDSRPLVVLTQTELKSLLPPMHAHVIEIEAVLQNSRAYTENLSPSEIGLSASNRLYVIYTSGSTGRPKGTAMPHRSMVNLIEWHGQSVRLNEGHRVLQFAALSFDVAFQEIFSTLCAGGLLVILEEWIRRDASALVELLNYQCVERLFVPPVMLQSLAETFKIEGTAPRNLKDVIVAGEQLRITPEIVEFFKVQHGCRLHNHYGPTETHVVTTLNLSGLPSGWPDIPTIGRPIGNTQAYVLDRRCQLLPIGVVGEIYIGGANLARGYVNKPETTAERFVCNPFSHFPGSRMYRTGDLGRWRADGTLEYLGRNDEQVKIRGYRIELGEIAAQLMRHALVREAAVVVREDAPGDKRLVAYVTPRDSKLGLRVEQLRGHLAGVLPDTMLPSAFVVLGSLPLTPSGKLNRGGLPAPSVMAYSSTGYEPPSGDVEERVARIWKELLHVERVGRHDNFFEIGGHSLLVVKALFKINREFGSTLTVTDAYRSPTLETIAARIGGTAVQEQLVDLSIEAALDQDIVGLPGSRCGRAKEILLTGGTGFVGRFLLSQLLQDTDAIIHCLVRAPSRSHARSRLKANLTKWNLWRDEFESRIEAIPGDLRLPRLGIDPVGYDALARSIDTIYHCATSMNHLETYAMAKPANVDSAKEVLKLATQQKLKLVNYISTLGVFSSVGCDENRVVNEASAIDHEKHWNSRGYVASKWVSEKIFLTAGERGIPCNIFRLGLVWADAQQGRFDELQSVYRVLKSCLLSGFGIEKYRYLMPPTPVDYVARATAYLGERHLDGQGIFHISSSKNVVEGVFECCNEIATSYSLKLVPYYEWIREIRRLHCDGRHLPVVPLIEYAFSMDERTFYEHQRRIRATSISFDGSRTDRELGDAGILAPAFNRDRLGVCLESMLARDEDLSETFGRKRDPVFSARRVVS